MRIHTHTHTDLVHVFIGFIRISRHHRHLRSVYFCDAVTIASGIGYWMLWMLHASIGCLVVVVFGFCCRCIWMQFASSSIFRSINFILRFEEFVPFSISVLSALKMSVRGFSSDWWSSSPSNSYKIQFSLIINPNWKFGSISILKKKQNVMHIFETIADAINCDCCASQRIANGHNDDSHRNSRISSQRNVHTFIIKDRRSKLSYGVEKD